MDHCLLQLRNHLKLVARILFQVEGRFVQRAAHQRPVLHHRGCAPRVEGLEPHRAEQTVRPFLGPGPTGHRGLGSVLAEEFRVCHGGRVEPAVVVLRAVEELAVGRVQSLVVLGSLHVEVLDPAELAVYVSVLRQLSVVGHPGSLHFVFLVGVQLPLRIEQHSVRVLAVFSKILLQTQTVSRGAALTL